MHAQIRKPSGSTTLQDIARETKTSISTVSRVLSGGLLAERISEPTRKKVTEAANRLGYRPNLIARSLRTRRTRTVALMVSDISNPWFGKVASLIEQRLHQHGYSLMLCNSGGSAEIEIEYLKLLPQKGIDGLILVPMLRNKKTLLEYFPEDFPLVILDRPIPGIPQSVSSNQEQLCGLLCDSLQKIGVKKVVIACGPDYIPTHKRRREIFEQCFEALGVHEGRAQRETSRQAYLQFASLNPCAVICTNNFIGQGYIDAMPHVDAQTAPIIGCFDDIPMMHHLPIPILCANQNVEMLAEACVTQLMPQLEEQPFTASAVQLPSKAVSNLAFQKRFGAL